jgi:hypothetical protein
MVDCKHLSNERIGYINTILITLPHSDSFRYALETLESKGYKNMNDIENLFRIAAEHEAKLDAQVFNGVRVSVHINPDDLALLNEASQGELYEPISTIAFEMAYLEPDKNIGQERQIPIMVLLGDERQTIEDYAQFNQESLEVCQLKLKSLLKTWLRSLGLAYDEESSTLIKLDTKKPPTQAELENMLSSEVGKNANKAITQEAKNTNLLKQNGELVTKLAVLAFNQRLRAIPVFDNNNTAVP